MLFEQITVVGVGLIGGSVGLAAKARGVARRVVGVGRDAKTLARAVELGAIDAFTSDLAEGVKDANLVVVCTPVDTIADVILKAAPHARDGTIFTDAGSTKAGIVKAVVRGIPDGVDYLGSHPIAGSEKMGVEHARADLFAGRVTVLTPTAETHLTAIERVEGFWRGLGSRVLRMDPFEHDQALAVTSHLPHAVAAGLVWGVPDDCDVLTGTGFRDTTRIASGDPRLWAAIFQANRDAVLTALHLFLTDYMTEFKQLLESGDEAGLVAWLTEAKRGRDALGS